MSNLPPGVRERDVNEAASNHWCRNCDRELHGSRQRKRGLCVFCEEDRKTEVIKDGQ
jgi:hypothetical protein